MQASASSEEIISMEVKASSPEKEVLCTSHQDHMWWQCKKMTILLSVSLMSEFHKKETANKCLLMGFEMEEALLLSLLVLALTQ